MSIEVLRTHWRNQVSNGESVESNSLANIADLAKRQARRTLLGGFLYVLAGLVVATAVSVIFMTDEAGLTRIELFGILAAVLIYGIGAWLHFKSVFAVHSFDCTVSEQLAVEITKARSQLALYQKLPLIVLTPMTVLALFIAYIQFAQSTETSNATAVAVSNLLIYAGLVGFTRWGLKREIETKLVPLVENLQALQKQLDQ